MSEPRARPRPRFVLSSPLSGVAIVERVRKGLGDEPELTALHLNEEKIELTMAEDVRRVWSPQLSVVLEVGDSGTQLHARFGPHPTVWTFYLAAYATMLLSAVTAAAWGVAQWLAGSTPLGLYLAPVGVVMAGLVFGASYVGQGLGSDQMYALRAFLERCSERSS